MSMDSITNNNKAKEAQYTIDQNVKNVNKRKAIDLEEKLEVLRNFDNGMKVMEIARKMDLNESTIRSIRKNENKIRKCAENGTKKIAKRLKCGSFPFECKLNSTSMSSVKSKIKCEVENNESLNTKKRKTITLEEKLQVLRKFDDGLRIVNIARKMNLKESTVRTIKKNESKIKKCASNVTNSIAKSIKYSRSPLLLKTETTLYTWICDQRSKEVALTTNMVQKQAKILFDDLKEKTESNEISSFQFRASRGWLHRFRKRFKLTNINFCNNITNDESDIFAEIENDVDYEKEIDFKQIDKLNETKQDNTTEVQGINSNTSFKNFHQVYIDEEFKINEFDISNDECKSTNNLKDIKNSKSKNVKELKKCFAIAENLKKQISLVENQDDRRDWFNHALDGLMSYYKNLYEKNFNM